MEQPGSETRPLRVAVVGSGPSGFYAAEALFKADAHVDVVMFDRLPTPYGLVRGGVAPDHAKIKNVIKVYDRIAGHERFSFLGNVTVGEDVSVAELRRFFDAVLFTSGAETDRRLGIDGEDLPGSHTATEFVGWYNAHPDYRDREFDLSGRVAVVIGQGNVAMDVCRILAKTVDELKTTDIAAHALEALAQSRIEEIHMIGRRGPAQAKFTPPEIKEFGNLAACDPVVDPRDLELNPESETELQGPDAKHNNQNMDVLRDYAGRTPSKPRRFVSHFLKGPAALEGEGRVQRLVLSLNALKGEPGNQWAEATGETETMPCDILFRSIGYRGVAIPGVPFDDKRGTIPNQQGRITEADAVVPGLYAAGWIKRGPSGVIGTNKPDSVETVQCILEDAATLTPCPEPDTAPLTALLAERGVRPVSYADWQAIDAAEVAQGEAVGKPREKFATIAEMLAVLD